jgi:hypothetical protein
MKIKLDGDVCTLTSENKAEMVILMDVWKGDYRQTAKAPKSNGAETETKQKRATYTRTCAVVGCGHKVRGAIGMAVHMHRVHGIRANGDMVKEYTMWGKTHPVTKPVLRNGLHEFILANRVQSARGDKISLLTGERE